jgi:2-oxo-3-hexenedioate decarboxylase/2-keto-4-pentenoate hydratase
MGEDRQEAAAALLAHARRRRERFDRLPDSCRPRDEAEAYLVQDRLHARLQAEQPSGLIGRKIGCTTEVMQRYLGIDSPCAGGLYECGVHETPAHLRHSDFLRVGVECEIAVRLSHDLPPTSATYNRDNVGKAVESCMAAIEIVDDRYLDYSSLDTPTLIADDFFNAGAVLGLAVRDWRSLDLAGLKGRMGVDGEIIGEGAGAAILGHPFEALAWLANAMNARGQSLRAGDLVLLGSLVQTQWVDQGQTVEITVDGLGGASVRFD